MKIQSWQSWPGLLSESESHPLNLKNVHESWFLLAVGKLMSNNPQKLKEDKAEVLLAQRPEETHDPRWSNQIKVLLRLKLKTNN